MAEYLSSEHGIGARDGRFCAHPLLERLTNGQHAVRVSLGIGSSSADVERLAKALQSLVQYGVTWTYGADDLPAPDPRPLPTWL